MRGGVLAMLLLAAVPASYSWHCAEPDYGLKIHQTERFDLTEVRAYLAAFCASGWQSGMFAEGVGHVAIGPIIPAGGRDRPRPPGLPPGPRPTR